MILQQMNTIRFICFVFVSALIFFCGCGYGDPGTLVRKFTPPEDEAIATNYIALLRQGKFEAIQKDMDPSLKDKFTSDLMGKMAAAVPKGDPLSVKVIGAHQFRDSELYQINLSFEYQFPSNWMVINVATQRKDGITTIIGFHVYEYSDSLENLNKFTLEGKRPIHYAVLAFAILIPLFILYALVVCIRTKMAGKKWFWIIFILIGIGRFTINWTTGHWSFSPFPFLLFGAGTFAPPYSAWMISVSAPLGALLFLVKRKGLSMPVEPQTN